MSLLKYKYVEITKSRKLSYFTQISDEKEEYNKYYVQLKIAIVKKKSEQIVLVNLDESRANHFFFPFYTRVSACENCWFRNFVVIEKLALFKIAIAHPCLRIMNKRAIRQLFYLSLSLSAFRSFFFLFFSFFFCFAK